MLACLFWKNGFPVTCIARPEAVLELNKTGLRLQSRVFGDFIARPEFVSRLDFKPDILFITVKANELLESLDSVPVNLAEDSVIIPFLNGLEHIELLRGRFGKRIAVGMIGKVESKKSGQGVIAHPSPNVPEVEIASSDLSKEALQKIADVLRIIGIRVEILENEKEVIWRKLVRNNAISSLTALNNQPLGFIRNHPEWRKKLEACVKEGALIARAEGVDLDPEEVMKQINSLPDGVTSSLQRDIASGKDSEIEAILGAVLRRAEHYKISCPTIKEIYQQLKKLV